MLVNQSWLSDCEQTDGSSIDETLFTCLIITMHAPFCILWVRTAACLAQLVRHQSALRVARVRFPSGPPLRVLKQLRRRCCLCSNICKWLDLHVLSDKDVKPQVQSFDLSVEGLKITHTHVAKCRVVIPVLRSVSSTKGTSYRLPSCALTFKPAPADFLRPSTV